MTPELTALALAGLLQAAQLTLFAIPANIDVGPHFTTSPRDSAPTRQMSKTTARLQRAMNNHFEALILFTLAVVVVTLGNQSSAVTQTAAYLYLIARIAYVPAYYLGLRPWRSAIWFVGFLSTLTMIIAALL